jgi:hypothetical protein
LPIRITLLTLAMKSPLPAYGALTFSRALRPASELG